jgi:hypothetical protein
MLISEDSGELAGMAFRHRKDLLWRLYLGELAVRP